MPSQSMREGVTARQLIKQAMRSLGVLGAGQEPTSAELDDCMLTLRNVLRKLVTDGTYGQLKEKVITDDYITPGMEHIYKMNDQCIIILPMLVSNQDGYCDYGLMLSEDGAYAPGQLPEGIKVSPPRDGSIVRITDSVSNATTDWIYDGQIKSWTGLWNISYDYPVPMGFRDGEGLKALLAIAMADEFGVEPTARLERSAREFKMNLGYRWDTQDDNRARTAYF